MEAKGLKKLLGLLAAVGCLLSVNPDQTLGNAVNTYVGSESCQSCHERQYDSFIANAAKARSFEHVQIMKKGLTEAEYQGCLKCHTTAYGEPGGFTSVEATPALKNPGCEYVMGRAAFISIPGTRKTLNRPPWLSARNAIQRNG